MKILLKLKREGGSKIDIGGITYHFKANDKGHHVAEVKDSAHIKRFLSIPGYHAYDGSEPEDEAAPAAAPLEAGDTGEPVLDLVEDDDPDFDEDNDGDDTITGSGGDDDTVQGASGDSIQGATGDDTNSGAGSADDTNTTGEGTGTTDTDANSAQGEQAAPAAAPAKTETAKVDTRTPAQKRADTIAANKAAGGNSKPASAAPKKNPALAKK